MDVPSEARLSADDWTEAALEVLLADGPDAVAIQPLARSMGATKGSFYWHFATRDDLLRAALDRWLVVGTDDLIADVEAASDDPAEKARLFVHRLTEHNVAQPGQLRVYAAADHPDVRAALEIATSRRIAYIAALLRASGQTRAVAHRRATIVYATSLGHAQLARTTPEVLPRSARGRRELRDELTTLLLDDPRGSADPVYSGRRQG